MGWPTPKCGTQGGYQRHKRAGEDACDPCKEAHTLHAQGYRKEVRMYGTKTHQALVREARHNAIAVLVQKYSAEYQNLYVRELRRLKEEQDGREASASRVD
jgi:hypothetical protein